MDFQDIQRERDRLKGLLGDYENRKQVLGAGENIAEAFSSVPTLGEAMGKTAMRRPSVSLKGLEGVDPSIESKQKIEDLLTQYKMSRDKASDEIALAKRLRDEKDLAARGGVLRKVAPEYGLDLGEGAGSETYKTVEAMIKNKQDLKQKELAAQRESDWRQAMLGTQQAKIAKEAAPTPVDKMSTTDKARFDNVKMASDAINSMVSALNKGQSRYSLLGDNDFTQNLTLFSEAIGRMQSGGAIQKDEAKRFINMARSAFDDPEQVESKLTTLKSIMDDRMKTLGQKPVQTVAFQKKAGGASDAAAKQVRKDKKEMTDEEIKAELGIL